MNLLRLLVITGLVSLGSTAAVNPLVPKSCAGRMSMFSTDEISRLLTTPLCI